jgi:hypothetical protein
MKSVQKMIERCRLSAVFAGPALARQRTLCAAGWRFGAALS